MQELVNCSICGDLFKSHEGTICPNCIDDRNGPYQIVKDYILNNNGASIQQVSEATGVNTKLILKYIREGIIATRSR